MTAKGKITRDEVVEDKVLNIGKDYAKSLDPAIKANEEWLKSFDPIKAAALEFANMEKQFKASKGRKEFLEIKKKEQELYEKTSKALKAEQDALLKLQKVESEKLRTDKLALDIESKKERAKNTTVKKTIEEREAEKALNKIKREQAKVNLGLLGPYQKLSKQLDNARMEAKDLGVQFGQNSKQFKAAQKDVLALDRRLKKLDQGLGQSQRYVGNYERSLKGLRSIFLNLTSALGFVGGFYAFTRVLRASYDAVAEFDNGLKNVQKTTGLSSKAVNELGDEIVSLSRKLKILDAKRLLEYATVAGQLGVRGSKNILAFTETLAKLETASDIAGEEGGSSIARFLTLVDGGVEEVSKFGDEIVNLGNNFAATENEILANALAISQNTGIYRLARKQTLAYATATKAAGIESEITGSAIGRTLFLLEKAIRTGKGIDRFTNLTGKNIEQLKKQFNEDAGSVFNDIAAALNRVDKNGGSVNARLSELGIVARRDQRVIGTLATSGYDTLAKAIQEVEKSSGSLTKEFETASGKIKNRVKELTVAFDNLVLSIEDGSGPASSFFSTILEGATNALNALARFNLTDVELNDDRAKKQYEESSKYYKRLGDDARKYAEDDFRLSQQKIGNLERERDELDKLNKEREAGSSNFVALNYGPGGGEYRDRFKKVQELNKAIAVQEGIAKAAGEAFGFYGKKVEGTTKAQEENTSSSEENSLSESEAAKRRKEREDALNKTLENRYKLQKFLLEQDINTQERIFESPKVDFTDRAEALKKRGELEIELARLNAERQLEITKTLDDEQIKELFKTDTITKEQTEKLTDEQLLIYREYQAELAKIKRGGEDGEDSLEVERIKQEAEIQKNIRQKALEDEIRQENELFARKEGIYSKQEEAAETREKRIADIKKKYAIEALNVQVAALEELIQSEKEGSALRIEYEAKLAAFKRQISDLTTETVTENDDKEVVSAREKYEKIADVSYALASAITDLADAILQNKIEDIDAEIEKNNEKYDKALENENLSEQQRKDLQAKKKIEDEKLQKEKRKEQRKQAILAKELAVFQIALNTASAIIGFLANPGGLLGIGLSVGAGITGAIQLGAALAAPIPKYVKGTEDHPGGFAVVGEERAEVVEEPGKKPYIVDRETVLDLPRGTKVTPSVDEYKRMMRASILASVDIDNRKLNGFQASQEYGKYDKEMINELKSVRDAIKAQQHKLVINQQKPHDLNHEMFRFKNTNWEK